MDVVFLPLNLGVSIWLRGSNPKSKPKLHLRVGRLRQFFFRLNVHQHVRDTVDLRADPILNIVRDSVARSDCKVSADHNMQINVVLKPNLSYKTFFEANDAGNRGSSFTDMSFDIRGRSGVNKFRHRGPKLAPGIEQNHRTGAERCPIIRIRLFRQ